VHVVCVKYPQALMNVLVMSTASKRWHHSDTVTQKDILSVQKVSSLKLILISQAYD